MKVQVLALVVTCLAGADAAAVGPRAALGNSFDLSGFFSSLFGPGPSPNNVVNARALQDGLNAITKNLNDAANPTKGSGFLNFFPPQVPAALSAIQLVGDLNEVKNAINGPRRLLSSVSKPQIPASAEAATCSAAAAVLDAEKNLVNKINTALGSSLARDPFLSLVGRALGESSDGIDSLVDAIVKMAPSCQAPTDESAKSLQAVFATLIATARSLLGGLGSAFVKALLEFINLGSIPTPGPTPSGSVSVPPLPSMTPPPVPSISLPPIPSISLPPIPSISLPPIPSISLPPIPSISLPPISLPPISLPSQLPSLTVPSLSLPSISLPPISLPSISVSISLPPVPTVSLPPVPSFSQFPPIPTSLVSSLRPSSTRSRSSALPIPTL
ncbi:hypothetical protein Micbo1qcDRAFT_201892 [Microdochium bolleyi]|uniref:Hydrophobic surface binding protein A-domain-containing protein n=1 Tax=Microdochium bolleyi TaxID=196109 RepID=A0A136J9V7_9PEZI|nr:hypothetical protein Micbo1qcDRAFT_201892 [Microdochium bolleyi]